MCAKYLLVIEVNTYMDSYFNLNLSVVCKESNLRNSRRKHVDMLTQYSFNADPASQTLVNFTVFAEPVLA